MLQSSGHDTRLGDSLAFHKRQVWHVTYIVRTKYEKRGSRNVSHVHDASNIIHQSVELLQSKYLLTLLRQYLLQSIHSISAGSSQDFHNELNFRFSNGVRWGNQNMSSIVSIDCANTWIERNPQLKCSLLYSRAYF
jgi:hypothetical protein